MNFDLTILGFGVIGVETLDALVLKINKKQKIRIAIIEKNINNIPGGVAYSKKNSKFGFFNNPLRLSHPLFKSWIKKKQNITRIVDFAKNNPNYQLIDWLKDNSNNLMKKNMLDEIYFPRLVYSFYLKDKIIKIIKLLKKTKIKIFYFKGELDKLNLKNEDLILKAKSNFRSFSIGDKDDLLKISNTSKNLKFLKSKKIIIGNGLLPPKKIDGTSKIFDKNYIWDFYAEGGTDNLIKKINLIKKKKKKIIITFIGNKAGLLETTLQLKNLIIKKNLNIKINVLSKKSATLNKAKFSKNFKKFKLTLFNEEKLNKIRKANDILILLKKQFKLALSKNFNKYDVWTTMQKKNILARSITKLSSNEKKIYNKSIFHQIRNITRFTYSEPIFAKDYLEKNKKIFFFKGRATKIIKNKKFLYIKTDNKDFLKSDIVVNVSGPVNLNDIDKESNFVKSIKNNTNKIDKRGFMTNKNFMLTNRIFMPGMLSYNFNPSRQTIIRAITDNSRKVVGKLINSLSKH